MLGGCTGAAGVSPTTTPLRLDHAGQRAGVPKGDPPTPTLMLQGVAAQLQETVLRVFPSEMIFSLEDHKTLGWPSISDLVARGKQVMFVSGSDYGAEMQPYVFERGQAVCGWVEPGLSDVEGVPSCMVDAQGDVDVSVRCLCSRCCCCAPHC